jgi:hypothetical protein
MDRQRLIAQKQAAARQRRTREMYLRSLPDALREQLADAPVLFEPDNQRIRSLGGFSTQGFYREPHFKPAGLCIREFSWTNQVFAALADYADTHDAEPAHFQPFTVRAVVDDLFKRDAPAFGVMFGWARRNLPALFDATLHGFALATDSFQAGIVVSVVIGYLPEDPNPNEEIYQLAIWG